MTYALKVVEDKELGELLYLRQPTPEPRTCPACGEPPGPGWNTYCSVEHFFKGPHP